MSLMRINFSRCMSTYTADKIIGKLLASSVPRKRRKVPLTTRNAANKTEHIIFKKPSIELPNFSATPHPVLNKRYNVLNYLFMERISNIMSSHPEISERLLGWGIEVTRVKVCRNFSNVNIYWCNTEPDQIQDTEKLLWMLAGSIRSILSRENVIGKVPKLTFLRDKERAGLIELEMVLGIADYGPDHEPSSSAIKLNSWIDEKITPGPMSEQFKASTDMGNPNPLDMRQDMLGLDHQNFMAKLLANKKNLLRKKDLTKREQSREDGGKCSEEEDVQELSSTESRKALLQHFMRSRSKQMKEFGKTQTIQEQNMIAQKELMRQLQIELTEKIQRQREEDEEELEADDYDDTCYEEEYNDQEIQR